MLQLKNLGQRQETINITCPKCKKTFAHNFMQLPYPCYEARNEIDSERFDDVSIECPNCQCEIIGEVYATRKNFYFNVGCVDNPNMESGSLNDEKHRYSMLYALFTWYSASKLQEELRSAIDSGEEVPKIYGLTQKFIANLELFIISKDSYPSQRKNLEELEKVVNDFIADQWNILNSSDSSEEIIEVLPTFLEKTGTLMSKWYEYEISLLWKSCVQG